MFMSCKYVSASLGLALVLLEASCASGSSGLVPGTSAVNYSNVASFGGLAPDRAPEATIVGCKIVTPARRTILNPPDVQRFKLSPSFNPTGYVFYFEIGLGKQCYSLPQALYTTVPGRLKQAKSEVVFESGHNRLVLRAKQSYEYVAYAVKAKPARYIYVIDHASSDVSVFLAGSNGNVAPYYRIKNVGGNQAAPQGIAEDAKGYVYVTTIAADGVTTSVLVFAPGAHGNARPVRAITGPHTTLTNNSSDTGVGPDGSIYVNDGSGIVVFAPNADGDAKPVRHIKNLNGGGAAVSPSDLLYTTTAVGTGNQAALDTFGPTEHGHEPPLAMIEGRKARVVGHLTGVDAQGNVYLCRKQAVIEFAPYQHGDEFPIRDIPGPSFVGLQPIAVDGAGNVFAGDEDGARIYRFAPDADGGVAPVATIAGSNTGLVNPAAMAVGK
ncbi:MAG TPA: hypothetical protein VIW73_00265 [Candidatus Cybelea sp.]